MQFLGGISPQEFFDVYWEKKPLLIRAAVADASSLASIDDLKELALDEDFETRLITNDNEIKVKEGPLLPEDFNHESWTLACHNLNTLSSEIFDLQKLVRV